MRIISTLNHVINLFNLGFPFHLLFPTIFSAYANLAARSLCMPFLTIINTQEWHLSSHVSHNLPANRHAHTLIVKWMCNLFFVKTHTTFRISKEKKIANRHVFLIHWQVLYVTRVLLCGLYFYITARFISPTILQLIFVTILTQAHLLRGVVEVHVITEPASVYPCIPKSSCVQQ